MSDAEGYSTDNAHHVTVEIASMPLRLREDLCVSMQVYGGETCYVIEDPLSSRFYRVGLAEYTLLSLLDGKTTIAQALGTTAAILGPHALSEQEAAALCKWLVDSELAATLDSSEAERLLEVIDTTSRRKRAAKLNPLFQKVPLLDPDPWATRLHSVLGWSLSRTGFVLWLSIVTYALHCLVSHWDRFVDGSSMILDRNNWVWLVVCWLVLKLVHESAHALACKRFGGTVREAGMMFILLAPLPYVDVTSSWRFDSKWKRICTAAAGMYAELFVAACAAIVYSYSDVGLLHQHARNVFFTASLITLLFNANPLMRFDGYYILSDWLELPNLATHGSQLLRYVGKRAILGMSVPCPSWPEGRTVWIAAYGIAAWVFRIFISVILIVAAENIFFGAGVVLAVLAVLVMFVIPGLRVVLALCSATRAQAVQKTRIAIIGCLAAWILWLGWSWIPWYRRVTAPAIVDFYPAAEVRSPVGGFVREILVGPGDHVSTGQLLVRLENEELRLRAQRLQIEIEQAKQRARKFRQQHEIAALQIAIKHGQTLEVKRKQLCEELAQLEIRAPQTGQIISCDLRDGLGTFIQPGSKIASIGSSENKRIVALVSQQDLEPIRTQVDQAVSLYIWGLGGRNIGATLEQLNPRASSELTYPQLSSLAGGPLAVKRKSPDRSDSKEIAWEFAEPHFSAIIHSDSAGEQFTPGQTGFVEFRRLQGTIGEAACQLVTNWFRNRHERVRKMR